MTRVHNTVFVRNAPRTAALGTGTGMLAAAVVFCSILAASIRPTLGGPPASAAESGLAVCPGGSEEGRAMYASVRQCVAQRIKEFDGIPAERKARLKTIAVYVGERVHAGEPARLTFICTHNSRRSQLSQVWASLAAAHYGVFPVETFSGGTEATAFNPRAVAALERAGLKIARVDDGENPRYEVRFRDTAPPLVCFSKVYDAPPNPKEDFCAVMTCSQADEQCPVVNGASLRVSLPFDDPKAADGKPEEAGTYDERSRQISREMLYLFSQLAK